MLEAVELVQQFEIGLDFLADVLHRVLWSDEAIQVLKERLESKIGGIFVQLETWTKHSVCQPVGEAHQLSVHHDDVLLLATALASQDFQVLDVEILFFGA